MTGEHAIDLGSLLEHRSFVLRVAQRLLRDSHDAEDVAQQTWASVARDRPARVDEPKSWLGRITRHHAFNFMRGRARRARRDRAAAAPERIDPEASVSERVETAERVVRAVMALDEPYRSTVLLHYYDDLPTRAIAQRHGVSIDAVRWRLERGLERMRRSLEGDDAAPSWRAGLAAFVTAGAGASAAANAAVAIAVVVVAAIGVGVAIYEPSSPSSEPSPIATTQSDESPERDTRAAAGPAIVREDARIDAALVAAPETALAHGLVTDAMRRPIAGATVFRISGGRDAIELGKTDESGTFAVDPGKELATLRIEAERFFPAVRKGVAPTSTLNIVLEPGTVLEGRVENASTGAPIARAGVIVDRGRQLDTPQSAGTMTDAQGNFRIIVPLAHSTLRIHGDGFAPWRSEAFQPPETQLVARLVQLPKYEPTVYVRVRAADTGGPLERVTFDYGPFEDLGNGLYFVTAMRSFPGSSTIAWRAPAFDSVWREIEDGVGATRDAPLELTLARAAVCKGRVVDEHGEPLAGAAISLSWDESDIPVAQRLRDAKRIEGAMSDAEGRFVCDHLPVGRSIDVRTRAQSRVPATVAWTSADPEPTLRLVPAATFDLRVLDAQTRSPIDEAEISMGGLETVRLSGGLFRITCGEGDVRCVAHADGFASAEQRFAAPSAGDVLEIELERGFEHTVVVKDSDGLVIVNAPIEASAGTDSIGHLVAITDVDGVATLRGITAGRWSVIAHDGERQSPSETFDAVGSGGRTELILPRLTGVRGRVRVASGLPPAEVQVTWFRHEYPNARSNLAKEIGGGGSFFIGLVPAIGKPCTLAVDAIGFETVTLTDIVVQAGEVRDLEFVLVRKQQNAK